MKETIGQLANAEQPVRELVVSDALLQTLGNRPINQIDSTLHSKKRDKT